MCPPMSSHAPCNYRQSPAGTKHQATEIPAKTVHPSNITLLLGFVDSLPKPSLFLSERNEASSLLPPEHHQRGKARMVVK